VDRSLAGNIPRSDPRYLVFWSSPSPLAFPADGDLVKSEGLSSLLEQYLSLHAYTVPHTLGDDNLTFLHNTLSYGYYHNLTVSHHHGLVSMPDHGDLVRQLDLPVTGLATQPEHSIFKVSAFHHLHCLSRIRDWITSHPPFAPFNVTEYEEVYPLADSRTAEALEQLNEIPLASHALHCVDWLRQVLTCDADLRLTITNTDPMFEKLGGERQRMCRDWSAITKWVDQHQ
jgi:hypothetical protein